MKSVVGIALLALSISSAAAQQYGWQQSSERAYGTGSNPNSHYVEPYVKSNGTTTQGHDQTNPNSTQTDNYGTRGNVNPYTGQVGTPTPRY
jgi:hypothetical protein